MVYKRYGHLTQEEKREVENEVGAAMEAYEMAVDEIKEWLRHNAHRYTVLFIDTYALNKELDKVMKG